MWQESGMPKGRQLTVWRLQRLGTSLRCSAVQLDRIFVRSTSSRLPWPLGRKCRLGNESCEPCSMFLTPWSPKASRLLGAMHAGSCSCPAASPDLRQRHGIGGSARLIGLISLSVSLTRILVIEAWIQGDCSNRPSTEEPSSSVPSTASGAA